ncbi:isoprenylcysteine carboxyl methyltransferase family protein [Shouchella shacheensis]|uniref:isoprenylcysteine carboxyl methyltransferase family protein n=1 Tax=Shouchella shacheensis TaxID=1649580 RepID=UPI00073FD5D7|nr:isoprenylcysteine carboxyl methyltransferase family protein [Shouchella shacheensis]
MTLAYFLIALIISQRLTEVLVAKRNERWLKERGGIEAGAAHYPYMVSLHVAFFLALLVEVTLAGRGVGMWSIVPFLIVLAAQCLRVWALLSLGRYWNTKIIVLPEAPVIERGPYRYFRHPNYLVVVLEIAFLPLVFQAYWTALLFSLLNGVMLVVRIRAEEEALAGETNYEEGFKRKKRFWLI